MIEKDFNNTKKSNRSEKPTIEDLEKQIERNQQQFDKEKQFLLQKI